jgi:hypothetical protein
MGLLNTYFNSFLEEAKLSLEFGKNERDTWGVAHAWSFYHPNCRSVIRVTMGTANTWLRNPQFDNLCCN